MPGPSYQKDGLFFDQHAHHNIPGYQDNVMVRLPLVQRETCGTCFDPHKKSCTILLAGRIGDY